MEDLNFLLFNKIKKHGKNIAVKLDDLEISYDELNNRALALASILISFQEKKNQGLVILGQRNIPSYISILACIYSGFYYTPINNKQNKKYISQVINDSKIKVYLSSHEELVLLKDIVKNNSNGNFIIIDVDKLEIYKNTFDDNIILKKYRILDKPLKIPIHSFVYKLYTSGSTGLPKGVEISHNNLLAWVKNMEKLNLIKSSDNLSQNYDLTFDLSVADYLLAWISGAKLCILKPSEQLLPYEYIQREKITVWSSVPTIANFLNDYGMLEINSFPKIKVSLFCGEALTKKLADAWQSAAPNSIIENFYGPTEATIWLSHFTYKKENLNENFTNSIIPIGKPFTDHLFKIIDENGKLLEDGTSGEIIYSGPQVSSGYSNNELQSKKMFKKFDWDKDNKIWYLSGDLGFRNKKKDFEFIGRKDNQIKIAGRRVEIAEIESTILKYDGIDSVVVIPIRNESLVCEQLIAFVTKKLTENDEISIREIFFKNMDKVFYPKEFKFIEKYPTNSSGKIDRKYLETKQKST